MAQETSLTFLGLFCSLSLLLVVSLWSPRLLFVAVIVVRFRLLVVVFSWWSIV
jgi:hypothetical protein